MQVRADVEARSGCDCSSTRPRRAPPRFNDGRFDYVAWNEAYARVRHDPDTLPPDKRDMVWMMFTDPANRAWMVHWEQAARAVLSQFRVAAGLNPEDPRFAELVSALSKASPLFRQWWSEYPVRYFRPATIAIRHPRAGVIALQMFQLRLVGERSLHRVASLLAGTDHLGDPSEATSHRRRRLRIDDDRNRPSIT
jgi:MmyB-like transcription regulator ligand binding domain